jgi:hypothetical protein
MDYRNRTLPEESEWDSVFDVNDYIEWATFAVLHTRLERRAVSLCHTEDPEKGVWHYVALEWREGDGLHYDGDGSIGKTYLQEEVEAGRAEVTTDWAACEAFIAPLPEPA